MKKDQIVKLLVGTVCFSTFCAACSQIFIKEMNPPSTRSSKYFENKGSGMYTRPNYKKTSNNYSKKSYGRVIYIGEPIDGVMDFN